ncbi:MAG: 1-acyl-sn-glycerol-3-phosphate acyltransferase [Oscillospiraceae bacterium]|jgi:1-acyl-sn-glycerol-3-phosphate acyltransferase|nr:1-acyl-sn-glycerol-3-phosphate acyltransferase [Oscillospiraceae bacterium]
MGDRNNMTRADQIKRELPAARPAAEVAVPAGGTVFYRAARSLCAFVARMLFRVTADGRENIPRDRNFILLSNHISAWDSILLAAACSEWQIHFLAKESLFKFAPLRWAMLRAGAIRIARGGSNLAAMRSAMQVVRQGRALGIFPEGHRYRTGKIERMESGVAMLVMNTSVPLLPAKVSGEYGFRKHIHIRFGAPVELADLRRLPKDADTIEKIKDRLTGIMANLS